MKRVNTIFNLFLVFVLGLSTLAPVWANSFEHQKPFKSYVNWQMVGNSVKPSNSNQGTYTPLVNGTSQFGPPATLPQACQPLLLTDGTVMVQNCDGDGVTYPHTGDVWKLTPDIYGNYINGTWSKLASLPIINGQQYIPLYFASQVLNDGRVIYAGGEYQGPWVDFLGEGANGVAIYDPVKDSWTPIAPPSFFTDLYPPRATCPRDPAIGNLCAPSPIADGQSVVLNDGTFMIADKMSTQAALLDLKTLTWTETGTASKAPRWNDEESYTLLPNGKILTVNCYTESHFLPEQYPYPADPTGSQIYDPQTGLWSYAGSTINTLTNPISNEIGSQVLRPDGLVFVGGTDGHNSLYNYKTGKWSETVMLPTVPSLTPFMTISAPAAAAGTYNNVYPGSNAVSISPYSVTGPIVQTTEQSSPTTIADASQGPYAPLPPNSIALIGISYAQENAGFDPIASAQAAAAGAKGIIFYITDGPNSLLNFIGGSISVPTILVDYPTGQTMVNNITGLTGTMQNSLVPQQLGFGDDFAALLPNGNIYMYATASSPFSGGIDQFFELKGSTILLQQNPEPNPSTFINMVLLPTGQILISDIGTGYVGVYTSADTNYNPAWAPTITSSPQFVSPGNTYRINGLLFNGMSQATHGSDDGQSATNYPLVRITMNKTHHVFYCRTHDHSFMGVAAVNKPVYTYFDVPTNWAGYPMEIGPGKIEVIANGIPSPSRPIVVTNN